MGAELPEPLETAAEMDRARPAASSSRAPKLTKRACDRCNLRRVKCDGQQPCRSCTKQAVDCRYDKPVLRKGPAPKSSSVRRASRLSSRSQDLSEISERRSTPSSPSSSRDNPIASPRRSTRSPLPSDPLFFPPTWLPDDLSSTSSKPFPIDSQTGTWPVRDNAVSKSLPVASILERLKNGQSPPTGWRLPWPNVQHDVSEVRGAQGGHSSSAEISTHNEVDLPRTPARWDTSHSARNDVGLGGSGTRTISINQISSPNTRAQRSESHLSGPTTGEPGCRNSRNTLQSDMVSYRGQSPQLGMGESPSWEQLFSSMPGQDALGIITSGQESSGSASMATWANAIAPSFDLRMDETINSFLNAQSPFGSPPSGFLLPSAQSSARRPTIIPNPMEIGSADELSPMFTLTLDTLIKPQIEIFFDRIHPMIPIFTRSYISNQIENPNSIRNRDFMTMILAMTALSLIHPLNEEELPHRQTRTKQATILIDEALRLGRRWDFGCSATFETVMTSYFIFGTLFEMGHAAGAKFRLKEAISLGETMGLDDANAYIGLGMAEMQRRIRLYWVLSVTERAYALQRTGSIVFEGTISTSLVRSLAAPQLKGSYSDVDNEPISQSLRYLAQLFSFIDHDIVACWNGKCDRFACTTLTTDRAVDILSRLGGSPSNVFGEDFDQQVKLLTESQRADLLITWQWIKNRIWRLAALHGLTTEGAQVELSSQYLVDITMMTMKICHGLSMQSMEAHGTGFVEKLYDITSAIPNLLRDEAITPTSTKLFSIVQTGGLSNVLQQLFTYVARHRQGGSGFVAPLGEAVSALSCVFPA